MIVFYDNGGNITGYQTFPASYSGPESCITVADGTSLTNKKVVNGVLVSMTQEDIAEKAAADSAADLSAWRSRAEVTKRQGVIALHNLDNGQTLETIKSAVLAAGGLTQIDWETASTFKRMNSTVLAIQQVMGWTDEQLDNLFRAAEQVPT